MPVFFFVVFSIPLTFFELKKDQSYDFPWQKFSAKGGATQRLKHTSVASVPITSTGRRLGGFGGQAELQEDRDDKDCHLSIETIMPDVNISDHTYTLSLFYKTKNGQYVPESLGVSEFVAEYDEYDYEDSWEPDRYGHSPLRDSRDVSPLRGSRDVIPLRGSRAPSPLRSSRGRSPFRSSRDRSTLSLDQSSDFSSWDGSCTPPETDSRQCDFDFSDPMIEGSSENPIDLT